MRSVYLLPANCVTPKHIDIQPQLKRKPLPVCVIADSYVALYNTSHGDFMQTCIPTWKEKAEEIHQRYLKLANAEGELGDHISKVRFLALAIAGEAGELANPVKKEWRGSVRDYVAHDVDVADELADIRIYVEHMASLCGVDLDEACEEKLITVEARLAAAEKDAAKSSTASKE